MNAVKVHIKNLLLSYLMELLQSDNENIYKNEILKISKMLKDY